MVWCGNCVKGWRPRFGGEGFQAEVEAEGGKLQQAVNTEIQALRELARGQGLDIMQSQQGAVDCVRR